MDILGVDLDEINLDDYENFDEDGTETITYIKRLAWHSVPSIKMV